jgi:hypothetical protein
MQGIQVTWVATVTQHAGKGVVLAMAPDPEGGGWLLLVVDDKGELHNVDHSIATVTLTRLAR